MIASELFDLSDLSVEEQAKMQQAILDAHAYTNTPELVTQFLELQESFSAEINAALEPCYIYIMPLQALASMASATSGVALAYTRNTRTGNQLILIGSEMLDMSAKSLECLIYHELVHAEQYARGDMLTLSESIVWKGVEYPLAKLAEEVQAAAVAYMSEGKDPMYATVMANAEVLPWEGEAYAKMFLYAKANDRLEDDFPEELLNNLTALLA